MFQSSGTNYTAITTQTNPNWPPIKARHQIKRNECDGILTVEYRKGASNGTIITFVAQVVESSIRLRIFNDSIVKFNQSIMGFSGEFTVGLSPFVVENGKGCELSCVTRCGGI